MTNNNLPDSRPAGLRIHIPPGELQITGTSPGASDALAGVVIGILACAAVLLVAGAVMRSEEGD